MKKTLLVLLISVLLLTFTALFVCCANEQEQPPREYKATFVVDGQVIDKVTFTESDTSITEPTCAEQGYFYVWNNYTLGNNNILINGTKYESIPTVSLLDESIIHYSGRNSYMPTYVEFYNSCSGFELTFYGTELRANFGFKVHQTDTCHQTEGKIRIYVDDDTEGQLVRFSNNTSKQIYLCKDLPLGLHKVRVSKCNSEFYNTMLLTSIRGAQSFVRTENNHSIKLEFYGDSLTAGYDVENTRVDCIYSEDATIGYAGLTATQLDAQVNVLARSGISISQDAYGSGIVACDTFENYSYGRHNNLGKWDFSKYDANIVIVALGANDSTALQACDTDQKIDNFFINFARDYTTMVTKLRQYYPDAVIICTYCIGGVNKRISDTIKSVADSFGDNKILFFATDASTTGSSNHPTKQAYVLHSQILCDYIKQTVLPLLGLN